MVRCIKLIVLTSVTLFSCMQTNAQSLEVKDKQVITNGVGESEIAVSGDGQKIVIAVNATRGFQTVISTGRQLVFHSHNGGTDLFPASTLPAALSNHRDPSVTWTGVGKFYF